MLYDAHGLSRPDGGTSLVTLGERIFSVVCFSDGRVSHFKGFIFHLRVQVDHLVVYGFQYLLVCLFFLSELSYVKQDVPVQTSRRTVHSIFSAFLVLVTLAGVVVAAFRLVDDSVAVWRDGIEAISLVSVWIRVKDLVDLYIVA